jgi:hypothetical protein
LDGTAEGGREGLAVRFGLGVCVGAPVAGVFVAGEAVDTGAVVVVTGAKVGARLGDT